MRAIALPLLLLLPASMATAQSDTANSNFPRTGEVKLHGRIVLAPKDHRTFILRADSLLQADGRTTMFNPTRDKLIVLSSQTTLASGTPDAITEGQTVSVIGPVSAAGKPLLARFISGVKSTESDTTPPTPPTVERPRTETTAATLPELNARLVSFCRTKVGQKVGNGQCTALVEAGLRAVNAQRRYPNFPEEGDYVWGRRVYYLSISDGAFIEEGGALRGDPVLPGDIIQFRDATFEGQTPTGTYTLFAPHHTAVVTAVADRGRTLTVLEQNSNGRETVTENRLHLGDLKQGWLRIYRPRRAE